MYSFLSWIEFPDRILYLIYNDVYNTKRGKELQEHCKCDNDLVGHSAIEYYYKVHGGKCFMCTDFSDPDYFPSELASAIKQGKFAGFGSPDGLLKFSSITEYGKNCRAALRKCIDICSIAKDAYNVARNFATENRNNRNISIDEYYKICNLAWEKYNKDCSNAEEEFNNMRKNNFWKLFADVNNRMEAWK